MNQTCGGVPNTTARGADLGLEESDGLVDVDDPLLVEGKHLEVEAQVLLEDVQLAEVRVSFLDRVQRVGHAVHAQIGRCAAERQHEHAVGTLLLGVAGGVCAAAEVA